MKNIHENEFKLGNLTFFNNDELDSDTLTKLKSINGDYKPINRPGEKFKTILYESKKPETVSTQEHGNPVILYIHSYAIIHSCVLS